MRPGICNALMHELGIAVKCNPKAHRNSASPMDVENQVVCRVCEEEREKVMQVMYGEGELS